MIVELKSVEEVKGIHEAQLLTYMKLSGVKIGPTLLVYRDPAASLGSDHDPLREAAPQTAHGARPRGSASTIPDTLSSLVLGNRRALYQLLFHSAWQALRDSMRDECGIEAAATMVLHTWNQRLEHHAHVHALVPGSGPALDGESWIPCRQTRATRSRPAKPFLVDNRRLGHRFRDAFLAGLDRLRQTGKLRLRETDDVQSLVQQLADRDWVVFIEPPPNASCSPEQVLTKVPGPLHDGRPHFRSETHRNPVGSGIVLGSFHGQDESASASPGHFTGGGVHAALVPAYSSPGLYESAMLRRLEQHAARRVPAAMPATCSGESSGAASVRVTGNRHARRTSMSRLSPVPSTDGTHLLDGTTPLA